jgi:hypothetical protein
MPGADWEKVVTPVVDFLSARADVAGAKLALLGVSQAGYWVPRALAFEHRIGTGVADPGVVDVSTTVLGHLPHMMMKLLGAGEQEKFNRDMEWTLKMSPATRSLLALRMRPYGVTTPYEFFSAARDYMFTDEMIARVTTRSWSPARTRAILARTVPGTLRQAQWGKSHRRVYPGRGS